MGGPGPRRPRRPGPAGLLTHRSALGSPCSTRSGGRRPWWPAEAGYAARPPGPLGPARRFQRERSGLGMREGGSWPLPEAPGPDGRAAGLGWPGPCGPGSGWLWAPSPAQTHLHRCPGCGPRAAGGSGRVWLHCSSPSCTRPGWPRAGGSSHTGPSQSHRKLRGTRAVSGAALTRSAPGSPPLPEAGPARGCTPASHSRPRGQAAGSHLAAGRARPGGRGRPARCRCAPSPRPQPQTPPGQAQGRAGSPLVRTAPGHEQGPAPTLTLQARWACTSTLPRRQASPPWPPMLSTCLLPASSTWTCRVPATCGRQPGSAAVGDSARLGPTGGLGTGARAHPGPLLRAALTWIPGTQVVPEGQAGWPSQRPVLLGGQGRHVALRQGLRARVHRHVVPWGDAASARHPPLSAATPSASPRAGTLGGLGGVVGARAPGGVARGVGLACPQARGGEAAG